MADGVDLTVSGIDDVARYFNRIEVKTRAKLIAPALRKMQRPVVTAMRAKVPVRFGFLKRSLGIKQKRFRGGRVVWSRIAPRTGFRFRGEFIVNGAERVIVSPQGTVIRMQDGVEAINLCANNYLGLSSNPTVVEAARDALGLRDAPTRHTCPQY